MNKTKTPNLNFDFAVFTKAYVKKFNKLLKHQFKAWEVDSIDQAFIDEVPKQRSSQLSSALSVLGEGAIKAGAEAVGLDWDFNGGLSYDSRLEDVYIEHKFSSTDKSSWTGHPYSNKVPWHLLHRVCIVNNKVVKTFIGVVDVTTLETAWTGKPDGKTSYGSLSIPNGDIDKVMLINGSLRPTTQKNARWAKVLME